jgi:hypothetical protein
MDWHSQFLIECSWLDDYKLPLICLSLLPCQVGGLGQPWLRLLPPSFFGIGASDAAVSHLTLYPCVQQYPVMSHLGLVAV